MSAQHGQLRKSAGPVDLHLLDEIGEYGTTAAAFLAELHAARGRDVVLHVSSPGGDLFAALSMHNALRQHDGHVTAYIGGLCASAATVVALGADERVTASSAQWMCHLPWVHTVGNVDDHQAAIEVLTRAGGVLAELYAERCGGTAAQWAQTLAGGDRWYSARESVDAGLSHRVGEATPVAASAARRLRACQTDNRNRAKVAAAVRTATEHGISAAAQRARLGNALSGAIVEALRPRPTVAEQLVAAFGRTTR